MKLPRLHPILTAILWVAGLLTTVKLASGNYSQPGFWQAIVLIWSAAMLAMAVQIFARARKLYLINK